MQCIYILLFLVSHAFAESCVSYTFEKDYDELFTSNTGICTNMRRWEIGHFVDTDLTDHNDLSTTFIYPHPTLSCVTSFMFPIAPGGVIEVNIFMATSIITDQIQVLVMEPGPGGNDILVGLALNRPGLGTFVAGWHSLAITVPGNNTDRNSYVAIMGTASEHSTVLVDSFRYIPLGADENDCKIYQNELTTDATSIPTTEDIFIPSTEETIVPSTEDAFVPSTEDTFIPSTEDTIVPSTEDAFVPSTEDTFIPSTEETIVPSTEDAFVPSTEDTFVPSTEYAFVPSTEDTFIPSTEVTSSFTTEPTSISTTESTGMTSEATTGNIHTSEQPTTLPISDDSNDSFWSPLRIKILIGVLVSTIILTLLCLSCYCCCRSNGQVTVVVVKP